MPRPIATLLLAACPLALGACHTWTHAPGLAAREQMERVEMPWVAGELCSHGWCSLDAPDGEIQIADVHVEGVSDARTATRFKVRYRGTQADCVHPAPDGSTLACTIAGGDDPAATGTLEIARGCTSARIVSSHRAGSAPHLSLSTEVVDVLGADSPAREVSLVDRNGVMAFTDAAGGGLVLFTRPGSRVEPETVVAMVAYNAFLEMEGKVPQCAAGGGELAAADRAIGQL